MAQWFKKIGILLLGPHLWNIFILISLQNVGFNEGCPDVKYTSEADINSSLQ